jgi:hypothetical protein
MQALAPAEQREEAEELRLDDEGHVQVLRDHVYAERERGDAPEESASLLFCQRGAARGYGANGRFLLESRGEEDVGGGGAGGWMDSRLTRARERALWWTWCAMT